MSSSAGTFSIEPFTNADRGAALAARAQASLPREHHLALWSDASLKWPRRNVASWAVVWERKPDHGEPGEWEWQDKAQKCEGHDIRTTDAELWGVSAAFEFAVIICQRRTPPPITVTVYTDCQSPIEIVRRARAGIEDVDLDTEKILAAASALTARGIDVTLRRVPGHCGILGNEIANFAARKVIGLPPPGLSSLPSARISYEAAEMAIAARDHRRTQLEHQARQA